MGIARPLAAWSLTVAIALLAAASGPARAQSVDYTCGQEPGSRFSWVEWGFCDVEPHGPERARGVVIWNHGISGTAEQFRSPPALALRLLYRRGWDVIKINRHNLGESKRDLSLSRGVDRTLAEARAQRARGYPRVVLAGQSFGGYLTLEAAASADVFGAVAMAPGITTRGGGEGKLDISAIERLLQTSKAERLAVVFPPGDSLFDNFVRGPGALRALARRTGPFVVIDETATEFRGHGGGTGGRFALRYGACLADLITAEAPAAGRVACPEGREWEAARELLLEPRPPGIQVVREPAPELAPFAGLWFGTLNETVVVLGLAEREAGGPRLLYRAATPRVGGGLYAVRVEGGQLRAALSGPAVVLAPGPGGRLDLTWTSADGRSTLRGALLPAGALE